MKSPVPTPVMLPPLIATGDVDFTFHTSMPWEAILTALPLTLLFKEVEATDKEAKRIPSQSVSLALAMAEKVLFESVYGEVGP